MSRFPRIDNTEGKRPWWDGRASNPVGDATRRRVGSTPIPLRHCFSAWLAASHRKRWE